ncbi:DinB family protein [Pareuzebyella sediminis]|uniref:DinB family protein n=1 Tax=Pareuzebyella sediminis TaxID=2607998 RepID=UPI0011EE0002|nr:DinB family protein [Pareuzebyella sediminis]
MDRTTAFRDEFVQNTHYRLDQNLRMVTISLNKVSEEQVWQKPNASLNSIGNLILHICGNMTQYGIASLLEIEDSRDRDNEFFSEGRYAKVALLQMLSDTVDRVKESVASISISRMLKHQEVQGYDLSGIGNIIHLVEHFSYHTGQIAFWVKLLNDEQLGFYDGIDLNAKNKP